MTNCERIGITRRYAANCFRSLSHPFGKQGRSPEQVDHIFLCYDDRAGRMVEVGSDLAIHSGQKTFENQDQHHCQCHPANAQSQASLVLKEITASKKTRSTSFQSYEFTHASTEAAIEFRVCRLSRQETTSATIQGRLNASSSHLKSESIMKLTIAIQPMEVRLARVTTKSRAACQLLKNCDCYVDGQQTSGET